MSISGSWGNSNHLAGSFGVLNRGVLASAWVYGVSVTNQTGCSLASGATADSTLQARYLCPSIGGQKAAYSVASDTHLSTSHPTNTTSDTWEHIAGHDPNPNDLYVWLNDVRQHNYFGTGVTPNAPTLTRVGCRLNGTYAQSYRHAEISTWDVSSLSVTEVDDLVNRLYTLVSEQVPNPRTINEDAGQPWNGKLLRYWPLTTNSDIADVMESGDDFSVVGTVSTNASHPNVATYTPATSARNLCLQNLQRGFGPADAAGLGGILQ